MDMSWQAMLHDAAAVSFEETPNLLRPKIAHALMWIYPTHRFRH
mgnify:CR=1 FL=1